MKDNNNQSSGFNFVLIVLIIACLAGFLPLVIIIVLGLLACSGSDNSTSKQTTKKSISPEEQLRQAELERQKEEAKKNSRSEIARQAILKQMEADKNPPEEYLKLKAEQDALIAKIFEDAKRAKELGL